MRRPLLLLGALFLALGGLVWAAGATRESYRQLTSTPAVYRSALDGGDAASRAAPLTPGTTDVDPQSNPTVAVSARFSASAATCELACVLYRYDGATYTLLGERTATAVAHATHTDGSRYLAPTLLFDAGAANRVEIRAEDPSSGNVTLLLWAYGVETR